MRPSLEVLEDRTPPAAPPAPLPPPPGSVAGLAPLSAPAPALTVTVYQNSSPVQVNLTSLFAANSQLQSRDGLRLSLLGNSNPDLVTAKLSDSLLTVTAAPGKSGAATLGLCATDADGVSVREYVLVTVLPLDLGGPSP